MPLVINDVAPLKTNHYVPRHKNNRYINSWNGIYLPLQSFDKIRTVHYLATILLNNDRSEFIRLFLHKKYV
jgi:hypothetical protein